MGEMKSPFKPEDSTDAETTVKFFIRNRYKIKKSIIGRLSCK